MRKRMSGRRRRRRDPAYGTGSRERGTCELGGRGRRAFWVASDGRSGPGPGPCTAQAAGGVKAQQLQAQARHCYSLRQNRRQGEKMVILLTFIWQRLKFTWGDLTLYSSYCANSSIGLKQHRGLLLAILACGIICMLRNRSNSQHEIFKPCAPCRGENWKFCID